ncbi:hypothetical protein [Bosea vestrisii]|uniref:Tellurite resistance protein TerB n=1 Tax=Bosea vestrisii TaxID=151416 RepID=A0ABW0H6J1_9HYPH
MSRDEGLAAALFALVIGGAIAIGIAIDVTAPLCDAAKIKSMAPDKIEFGCFEFWLNRYQTMLAGAAALVAATASVFYLRRQIAQADQHKQDQLLRDRAAARTVLPLALSTICEYASQSVRSLYARFNGQAAEMPPIPTIALDQLVATVRTLESRHVEPFARIVQELQVHNARVSDRRELRRLNELNLHEYLLDAAEIYARASSLFEFARFETDDLPSELFADQMRSALWSTGAEMDREGPLHAMIDRRERLYPKRSPDEEDSKRPPTPVAAVH